MFRELTRKKQELTHNQCIDLLKAEKRGVLSVVGDNGYPYGMPMNHWYNEADKKLYFHCGKVGHRLDSLQKDNKVSFCVYDNGYIKEGEWALNIKSVIVFGKIEVISAPEVVADITTKLSYKFTSDSGYIQNEVAQYTHKTLLLALTIEHICGKLVNEA